MERIKIGDLVKMKNDLYQTGLVGIVLERHPKAISTTPAQIGIRWLGGSGYMDWEPESWLEVISASR